jgi:hypothetical protein
VTRLYGSPEQKAEGSNPFGDAIFDYAVLTNGVFVAPPKTAQAHRFPAPSFAHVLKYASQSFHGKSAHLDGFMLHTIGDLKNG